MGGTCLAARLALQHGAAVNLAGGSHHAHYEAGAGFCVFNDVAVAAYDLLSAGLVNQVAVIDCDVHHGDGTASIFAEEPRVFTASLHCEDNWPQIKPPSDIDLGLPKGTTDGEYLLALDQLLAHVFEHTRPDIVFYNAGVDPHAEDRLGLLSLTDDALRERDQRVAQACRRRRVPIIGVLGGGYSRNPEFVARRHVFMVDAIQAAAAVSA